MEKRTLYHKAKKGDIRVWSVWSEGDSIYTEYGTIGGALQTSCKKAEEKNVGRSNETSTTEQADLEAKALYKFKLDRKYSVTVKEAEEELDSPMLAHPYNPGKKNYSNKKWIAQPKYNGVRCTVSWEDNKIVLMSRSGKTYDVAHISNALSTVLPKDSKVDGEIYLHDTPLQQIISLVKKPKDGSENLVYMVYDMPVYNDDGDLPQAKRLENLKTVFSNPPSCLIVSESKEIDNTEEEVKKVHREFVGKGYEGAILRSPEGLYLWGYRSHELLKVKAFQDAEFEVIDFTDGVGKMSGRVVFTCKNDLNDLTFQVTPKATMEERKKMFDEGEKYIGRKYTVQFFERSIDGIPIFPVGLAFPEDR